jgi:hypothetical protein
LTDDSNGDFRLCLRPQSSVMLLNLMIDWDELVVGHPIGAGGQGTVYKASWRVRELLAATVV